ncbi:hypothetical protein [Spiroplasma endosymbiont of Othius punctulatus]|uniref:hypothetical protein n=1 Tax=Spiroplasma endosymbiont of Othius punctulatus TaxID=3066289 RepID=UPI0030D2EADF
MKKLIYLLSAVTASSSIALGICAPLTAMTPNNYVDEKISLFDVIQNTDLGTLENGDESEIKEAISIENPNIDIFQIDVNKISKNLAQITPTITSESYYQTFPGIMVDFSVKPKTNLDDSINQAYLGEIQNNDSETILMEFLNQNPNITKNDVKVKENSITKNSVILTSIMNSRFKGDALIVFEVKPIKLSKHVKNQNIGFINNNNKDKIFDQLVKTNPNVVTTDIEVIEESITLESAMIKARSYSETYIMGDEILVKFETNPYTLNEHIDEKEIGEINNYNDKTIINALNEKTKINTTQINIIDVKRGEFKIQAKEDSNYYRFDEAVTFTFTLPDKYDLFEGIKEVRWIEYRDNEQIERDVYDLIVEKSFKSEVSEGIDYEIIKENDNQINVKSIGGSISLQGNFVVNLQRKYQTSDFDLDINTSMARNDIEIEKELNDKITEKLNNDKIDEKLNLSINKVDVLEFKNKHESQAYYKEVTFNINLDRTKIFDVSSTKIKWTNFKSPKYAAGEVSVNLTKKMKTYAGKDIVVNTAVAYVDSSSDHIESQNANKGPTRAYWDVTPPLEIGVIDYKSEFNFKSPKDFFDIYSVEVHYEWMANGWDEYHGSWAKPGGKNAAMNEDEKVFDSENSVGSAMKNSTGKVYNSTGFHHEGGDFGSKHKGAGAVQIWMEVKDDKIYFYCLSGAWYDWKNLSSYDHAGVAKITPLSILVSPK